MVVTDAKVDAGASTVGVDAYAYLDGGFTAILGAVKNLVELEDNPPLASDIPSLASVFGDKADNRRLLLLVHPSLVADG